MRNNLILAFLVNFLISSCDRQVTEVETTKENKSISVPEFNQDTAYSYIAKQVAIGPRVPNTIPHQKTKAYLVSQLERFGANVIVQEFNATAFDNTSLQLSNIIGEFFPDRSRRILLAAHWDTRPFADKDSVDKNIPIDGANDGASGVAVLLEIARKISSNPVPNVGVDIIFFDGEDWGTINGESAPPLPSNLNSWWCLGSQYWSQNKHRRNYFAYYGILLDMVGAENAQFHIEGLSNEIAPRVVEKVWQTAQEIGYGSTFIKDIQPPITDDHEFVNKIAKIPMINIVHFDNEYGYFGDFHHTRKDNLDIIDKEVLKAVGQTVLRVLYYE